MKSTCVLLLLLLCTVLLASASQDFWFDSHVDNFDLQNMATFRQRYWLNDTFYSEQRPRLILAFGGEAPLDDFYGVESGIMSELAARNKAKLVYLEHRYYGKSLPMGNSTATENYRYLSIAQALEDMVTLVQVLREHDVALQARDAVSIATGCSYSGVLSALFQQRYPTLAVGSISGSAPFDMVGDFSRYIGHMQAVLGSECRAQIRQAFVEATDPANATLVRKLFGICEERWTDAQLAYALGGFAMNAVQYDSPDNGLPMNAMCGVMQPGGSPPRPSTALERYAAWVAPQIAGDGPCLSVNPVPDLLTFSSDRSWEYQKCSEVGYFKTDSQGEEPPLFSRALDLDFYRNMCKQAFGQLWPDSAHTNLVYGSTDVTVAGSLFATNGHIDPWSTLGLRESDADAQRHVAVYPFGHCAPFHKPTPDDGPELELARERLFAYAKHVFDRNN
jgi:Serine carboxypeptidase S28